MAMVAKTVDSYRFLDGVAKRAMKRWAGLPRGNTDSMDSSRQTDRAAGSLVFRPAVSRGATDGTDGRHSGVAPSQKAIARLTRK